LLRRDLLTAAAGAAFIFRPPRAAGANDRIGIAIIGLGGRGKDHLDEFLAIPDVELVAICDVDRLALERAQAFIRKAGRKPPRQFTDMRELFESKDIDAVSMATPNHWHALGSIWAMQAGKDVYCEKPASHSPFESRMMIAAAKKYGRVLQVGSQSRSLPHKREAIRLLHEGRIGEVYMAQGLVYKRRKSIGHKPDSAAPATLDWNQFLGPAPFRPFNELRFHYNWHWFWDTGNGDMGNQGAHQMDVARWGLGLPDSHDGLKSVVSSGGKYVYDDDQETPNTQLATFDYGRKQIVFEVRGLLTPRVGNVDGQSPRCIGNVFLGSEGFLELDDSGYRVYHGEDRKPAAEAKADDSVSETRGHIVNFLDAVRRRSPETLHAGIEKGATSADLCHFANISYRVGRKLTWDAGAGKGAGDDEANRLMRREDRAPFLVPERV